MTEEPHLPNRNDLEVPLLRILLEMGGSIRFSSEARHIEIELARVAGVSDEDRDFSAPNYNIDYHGNSCIVCGFSFDAVYGADLARGFIEIHHTEPVAELGGRVPDIVDGLVPICSNCHSMVHRSKGKVVSIRELNQRIEQGAANNH